MDTRPRNEERRLRTGRRPEGRAAEHSRCARVGRAPSYHYLLGFAPLLTGVLIWLAVHERNRYRELRSLRASAVAWWPR